MRFFVVIEKQRTRLRRESFSQRDVFKIVIGVSCPLLLQEESHKACNERERVRMRDCSEEAEIAEIAVCSRSSFLYEVFVSSGVGL